MLAQERPPLDSGDALPSQAFVRVAALTARLLSVPIAVVSIRAEGDSERSLDADPALPTTTVAHVAPTMRTAKVDPRILEDAERAAGVLGLGFHATVRLRSDTSGVIGTLSVLDRAPRTIRPAELRILDDLAAVVVEEIEIWLAARQARDLGRAVVRHQQEQIDDAAVLAAAMRQVTAYEHPGDVRPAICRIALSLTGADSAALYEIADDDTTLVRTVAAGAPWPESTVTLADRYSAPVRAFLGGKGLLVTDDRPGTATADDLEPTGPATAEFWQPFAAGGPTSAAVIGLLWGEMATLSPVRLTRLMETFAAEAMRAIERAELLLRLEDLARTDELTQLPNRRAFNEALPQELQRAQREGHPVCVALLDLDFFKRYNDTAGHPAGDRLLATAATRWREVLRSGTDLLARYGGEEFVVVLPVAIDVAQATLDRMRGTTPSGQTASVGLAQWDEEETGDELLARADAALYAAKASGRDRIERAPHAMRIVNTA